MNVLRLTLAVLFASMAGCSPARADSPVYTRVSQASLQPGEAIPVPDEAVFTVTGLVGAVNQGSQIVMDLASIEAAGLVDYTVLDPFLSTNITYRGPLFSDLLDLWQVSPDATTLHMVALNDYTVDIPVALVRDYPIVFAIQADGQYMPVADRGPAMVVLPYDHFEFDRPASDAMWIWQVESIDIQ